MEGGGRDVEGGLAASSKTAAGGASGSSVGWSCVGCVGHPGSLCAEPPG